MKKIIYLALCILALNTLANAQIKKVPYRGAFAPAPTPAWTDTWTNFDPQNKVYPSTTAAPSGGLLVKYPKSSADTVISTNTTWTKNNTYIIAGLVFVKTGVTLTIEPGTVIFGSNAYPNSSLVITKGAKLIAEGTPTEPIVFTSMYSAGFRAPGNWGGIIMLGKASYNGTSSVSSPTASTVGVNYIEGLTELHDPAGTGKSTEFGGGGSPIDDDSSGVLKYVRVEFGGFIFSQNKEINGVTFGAVGNKTVVDYVQCSFINDDSFEFYGGSVNAKHLVSYRGVDDEWDTDNGFSGSVQFGLGVRDPQLADNTYSLASGSSTSEGYESDNDATGSSALPKTKAVFVNMTNIGPLRGDNSTTNQGIIHPSFRRAARLRRNSELKIFNSILADYPTGLFIDNANGNSAQLALDGKLKFKNNIVSGYKSNGLLEFASSGTAYPTNYSSVGSTGLTFFVNNTNDSTSSAASTYLTAPYGTATYPAAATYTAADYRPTAAGTAATGASFTDTVFTNSSTYSNWAITADTCSTPASVGSISYTGTTTFADSVRTIRLATPYTPASDVRLIWTISGTGNSITSGQGNDTLVLKVKATGTLICYALNGCGFTDTANLTLSVNCPNPDTATVINGNLYFAAVDSVQLYTFSNKYSAASGITSMVWSITGTGNSIISGQGNDSVSVKMKATGILTGKIVNVCGDTLTKTINITKATVNAPATVTQTRVSSVCGSTIYRYAAPALPNGARGYQWTLPSNSASLGTVTRDSGAVDLTGRIIRVKYTSNTVQAAGDTIKVKYTLDNGSGANKAQYLAKLAVTAPAAPATITSQYVGLSSSACGKIYRLIAPALTSPTTTAVPTGWKWSVLGNHGSGVSIDSGSVTSQVVRVRLNTNSASDATDSVYLQYTSACIDGLRRGSKLTFSAFTAPAKPATVTQSTIDGTTCGARVYQFAAPTTLPISTTTSQATGWKWTLPSTFTGTLVNGYNLTDSIIRVTFASNAASATTDSIFVQYNSLCGLGATKAQKLAITALTCLVGSSSNTNAPVESISSAVEASVYPNPNNGSFTLSAKTNVKESSNITIKLIDANGKVVMTTTGLNANGYLVSQINATQLTAGVYNVNFQVGGNVSNVKFVVTK